MIRHPPGSPFCPYPPLFRSAARRDEIPLAADLDLLERLETIGDERGTEHHHAPHAFLRQLAVHEIGIGAHPGRAARGGVLDRKSTRLNSSHDQISYAVFCLK